MDLRRERRRTNRVIGVLLLLIFVSVAAICAVWIYRDAQPAVSLNFPDAEGVDIRAVDKALTAKRLKVGANAADEFSFLINSAPKFENGAAEGDLQIENPIQNLYLMAVELALNDTGEVVFRSGYLKPNQVIETAALDEPLAKGEYAATAYICAVDFVSYDLLGILEQPVTITVQN